MRKLVSIGLLCLTTQAMANLHLAPPDFNTQSGRAVFVDFKKAHYEINFDFYKQEAVVTSRIEFEQKNSGLPLFDLVPLAKDVRVNGEKVSVVSLSFPGKVSKAKLIKKNLGPGHHVVEMKNIMNKNVSFEETFEFVRAAFWIRDLKERLFLEQYIPSNFEFDQYQISLDLKFTGTSRENQDIYTNGELTKIAKNHYRIEFPEYFTVSSPYLHITSKNGFKRLDFSYTSINGREIPITVYSPWWRRTNSFKRETIRVMEELEADYGAWAHPSFVAYGTMPGTGGMEHAGAAATSFAALDHEMLHSYFAKGVMPANGNSGWIDEAIAAWRDNGYPRLVDPGFVGSNIGGQSVYKRNTDKRSYKLGSAFMGYLDYRLQDMGGLKAFLKGYFAAYKHTVVTTEHFKNNLEFWSGIKFQDEFDRYILNNNIVQPKIDEENHYHKALSDDYLKSIL